MQPTNAGELGEADGLRYERDLVDQFVDVRAREVDHEHNLKPRRHVEGAFGEFVSIGPLEGEIGQQGDVARVLAEPSQRGGAVRATPHPEPYAAHHAGHD
jgi:hypothetical protein